MVKSSLPGEFIDHVTWCFVPFGSLVFLWEVARVIDVRVKSDVIWEGRIFF